MKPVFFPFCRNLIFSIFPSRQLSSPEAPDHFHVENRTLYHMGPGFHNKKQWKMRMMINTDVIWDKITNVIGVMKGSVEPGEQEWVYFKGPFLQS